MKKIIKKSIKYILVMYYSKKKNLTISKEAKVRLNIIKACGTGTKFLHEVHCSGKVKIGKYVSINGPSTRLVANINSIIIGNFCSIASNVVVQEFYHKYNRITSYYVNKNICNDKIEKDTFSKGDIIIEDDVWIGSNAIILSGVIVGRGSIVGAGAVVTKNVYPYSIVGGNPAKLIRKRFKDETIEILENLKWWQWDIEKIKQHQKIFNYSEDEIIKYKDEILILRKP